MGNTNDSPRKATLDPDLLAILCCPETKQDVSLADNGLINQLNDHIEKRKVKNKGDQIVTERLDGGLLRADRKILYPIRQDIPVMLIEEGILIEDLA